ncbi:type I 3-dehydroquinate dehydratase [Halococcus saccharolyticus]|uniref:3-dehydroquinate dehydratase n=1 Tax=Halococcus saccharolyticus DSM 5350 TaxID=1227455 RepID=M0MNI6_9EURY|nr:type I 3-dehydroquinate dehydratase [Halococcus saccharolyticus]EMA47262.1 3-dehydroquinate dehydratase [Halococcus saccharolyticus DSM 5350]
MNFESLVLAAVTADLTEESAAREHADAVEFRMDLAIDPLTTLDDYDGELPILATNRTEAEGGEAAEKSERLDVLRRAAEHPAVEAIDIELAAIAESDGRDVVEHAHEHDASVVVSAHDFSGTPSRSELRETLSRACEHGDVGKLATTATSIDDVLVLLSVTRDLDANGHRVATMAMGATGRHSRAIAPLYGSRIAYAPVDPNEATAPGQYDLATLADLLDALR